MFILLLVSDLVNSVELWEENFFFPKGQTSFSEDAKSFWSENSLFCVTDSNRR